jgi:hypothetical protein
MLIVRRSLPCVALLLAVAPLFAGETVSHPQLGFRLSVPDGFVQNAKRVQGDVVYAFERAPADGEKVGTFIVVRRLGGVLGREKLDPKSLAAQNPQVTLEAEKWKEFDIEVVRVPEQAGDLKMLTFNAQVPLKPAAIQVAVIGEAAREQELRSVLRSVLGRLEGSTNWLSGRERVTSVLLGVIQLVVTVGVLVAVAFIALRAVRKRKPARKDEGPGVRADLPGE